MHELFGWMLFSKLWEESITRRKSIEPEKDGSDFPLGTPQDISQRAIQNMLLMDYFLPEESVSIGQVGFGGYLDGARVTFPGTETYYYSFPFTVKLLTTAWMTKADWLVDFLLKEYLESLSFEARQDTVETWIQEMEEFPALLPLTGNFADKYATNDPKFQEMYSRLMRMANDNKRLH